MSQASRPRDRGTVRRRRDIKLDRPVPLEIRSMMAPVVATFPLRRCSRRRRRRRTRIWERSWFQRTRPRTIDTAAPITSVSELTPISSFGGDIVTIAAGPGGVFGNVVYAISRGAGDNAAAGRSIGRA